MLDSTALLFLNVFIFKCCYISNSYKEFFNIFIIIICKFYFPHPTPEEMCRKQYYVFFFVIPKSHLYHATRFFKWYIYTYTVPYTHSTELSLLQANSGDNLQFIKKY